MDFINQLQTAIDYMEDRLLEDISYIDVAKYLYISNYHFHRTFSLVTGITPNEYMRNRRLSEAGKELLLSDVKVIEIAYKYGYDSPESFSKAFTRFHNISPSIARRAGNDLKLFNRLKIKIILEGGTIMNYRIEQKESFEMLVKCKEFRNEIVNEENNTEIPDFWTECKQDDTFTLLNNACIGNDVFGACGPVLKESTHFQYGIGKLFSGGKVPNGFNKWKIDHELWAVFKCIGTDGKCIGDVWNKIFTEFLPSSPYEILDVFDFERYSSELEKDVFCEVWIPIKKK